MSEILLQTKLYTPPIQQPLVIRPRLIDKMNAALERRLTLISAPAGFGKSTLVHSWLQETRQQAAWLSLDELDNETTRFLRYFLAALAHNTAVSTPLTPLLQNEQTIEPRLFMTHLLNRLSAKTEPLLFVLEDFHVITNKSIVDALAFFIDHAPPTLHLIITSRADPALPLSSAARIGSNES